MKLTLENPPEGFEAEIDWREATPDDFGAYILHVDGYAVELLSEDEDGEWYHFLTPKAEPREFVRFYEVTQGILAQTDIGDWWFCSHAPSGAEAGAWIKVTDYAQKTELHPNPTLTFEGIVKSSRLPAEYQRRMLEQVDAERVERSKPATLENCVVSFCSWLDTAEGVGFWNSMAWWVCAGGNLPPIPNAEPQFEIVRHEVRGLSFFESPEALKDTQRGLYIHQWLDEVSFQGFVFQHPNGANIVSSLPRIWVDKDEKRLKDSVQMNSTGPSDYCQTMLQPIAVLERREVR